MIDDDSKILYSQIGFVTITIDEVLKHFIRITNNNREEYIFTKNIYQENDDMDYFGMASPPTVPEESQKAPTNQLTSS